MKLMKFKIIEVEEKSYDEEYSKGFDFKTKFHRTMWDYTIKGDDGNTYLLHYKQKPVAGMFKGKTLCVSVIQQLKKNQGLMGFDLEPNLYEIKYQTMSRPDIMSPQKFAVEVKKDIAKRKSEIEWANEEILRLQSLIS